MKVFPRTHEKLAQIVEDCAPRPHGTQQVQVTATVEVDPVWHGHDLPDTEKRDIVHEAINARPGLTVVEANTTTSLGESRVQ